MKASETPDLGVLLPSWVLTLRAERKSPATIRTYTDGIGAFLAWADTTGTPAVLDRRTVTAFCAHLVDEGREGATVRARQLALRRFSAWLTEEGEIPQDRLLGIKPAKLDQKVVDPLTEDQLKAMLKACSGSSFMDRRDEAMLRLMAETGMRAGECVALEARDLDLMAGTVVIRRGKGGKGRVVPFGPQTARALDRYRRARAQHPMADTAPFWLAVRSRSFGYDGLRKALVTRAKAAGIEGFHPHQLRHTAAHRWLAAGGSEGGLMAVAGWSRPDMLVRYTKARASERAATEARSLNLGDL
ncbi:tyrosine recombinase XerC [Sinomonas cyclohexanicum]|uniref:Tyrosine recombinase XerC n=1 Tax=Sinomonas cyclohexanicum TaxID=322009 RepID=A0ABM7PXB0_SINCY|nr:tyrosine-type recombinase/integrase [Corynebacterium cyclohexanicum]BCT76923.1 tyrosine recombinase XerC [Corynebacterium cyclohexanicum]